MENDRPSEKKNQEDASISEKDEEENTLYVTANDQPGQITINLERDMKRKITIISEAEKPKRPRRDSADLRRQAILNSAIRSAQSKSRSRSRSRSRGRSSSLNEARSVSGGRLRSRSRSHPRSQSISIPRGETKSPKKTSEIPIFRLPTDLCNKSVLGNKKPKPPSVIELPSPLYVLSEQQVTGASEKKVVQFVTKILLTSHKLTKDEQRKLYGEMVEAEYIGTSRSSTDLNSSVDEPEEGYELKIYYSSKGIYIHSVQNVQKVRSGKKSKISEEKGYSNICKTKIIGDHGKFEEGMLNITCSETITAENQSYKREEKFKIGLRDVNVKGHVPISSKKTTFDPTKTTNFHELLSFDNNNIGIEVNHVAIADMKQMWENSYGSFGEEQSEYREIKFHFEGGKEEKKGASVVSVVQTPKKTPTSSGTASTSATSSASTASTSGSASSRRSRSRAKRHRAIKKLSENSINKKTKSPDRETSRKVSRPDDKPIQLNDSSFYHSFPAATSTPKSPSVLVSNTKNVSSTQKTPSPYRGSIAIKEHNSERHSDNEIDLDKSLSQPKKPSASKNLAQVLEESKKMEEARQKESISVVSKPPTSPGNNNSVYMYNTKSANNSTYMSAKELHEDRLSASSGGPKSSTSPQGTRRVKETKTIREVREENGKPAEIISEKKEETVKEEKVKLNRRSRSASPATPKMKSQKTVEEKRMVILSAAKETFQSLDVTPIKVSEEQVTPSVTSSPAPRAFKESVQLDMLIDQKRFVLNLNFVLLAEKQPEIELMGFSFKGQKMWERSSEWNLSSANTTSHTKTIARQASNILDDGKEGDQKK